MSHEEEYYRLVSENEYFVVIDKRPEVSFHTEDDVLGVSEQLKKDLGLDALYPVHRLDRITSGLLVFGKKLEFAQHINQQFQNRQIEKYYLALSDSKPKKKQGHIRGDMEKARRGNWKLTTGCSNPAHTMFFSVSVEPGIRLYLLKPLTGRTHQLRVALKSIGAPILGDRRYGGSPSDRAYLHAFAIAFEWQQERFEFVCEPGWGELFDRPGSVEAITKWCNPWQLEWPKG